MPNLDQPQEVIQPFSAMMVISFNDFNLFLNGDMTGNDIRARAFRVPFDFKVLHDAQPSKTPPLARLDNPSDYPSSPRLR